MKEEKDKIIYVPVEDILPNRFQPRLAFNEKELNELASSITKYGVIQPIVLRSIGDKYEIIAGERRYKASVLAGLKTIPAILNEVDDNTSAEIALLENLQRKNLTPVEEAQSFKKLLDRGFRQDEIASKLGISQSTIANKVRLLTLPKKVQDALLYGRISERHARSLLSLNDEDLQLNLLEKIISEKMTVKQTEEEVSLILGNIKGTNDIPENIKEFINIPSDEQSNEKIEPEQIKAMADNNQIIKEENITKEKAIDEKLKELLEPEPQKIEKQPDEVEFVEKKVPEVVDIFPEPKEQPKIEINELISNDEEINPFQSQSTPEFNKPIVNSKLENEDLYFEEIKDQPINTEQNYQNQEEEFIELSEQNVNESNSEELKEIESTEYNNEESSKLPSEEFVELNEQNNYELNSKEELIKNYNQETYDGIKEVSLPNIISEIRECVGSLNKKSGNISINELDLDDRYQIIIEIKKDV